jgi:hypothetical protein
VDVDVDVDGIDRDDTGTWNDNNPHRNRTTKRKVVDGIISFVQKLVGNYRC